MIPTYLEESFELNQIDDYINIQLKHKDIRHEVYYYGDLLPYNNEIITKIYVEDFKILFKLVLRELNIQKDIVLYDQALYGYDSLFVDEYDQDIVNNRELKNYKHVVVKQCFITLGYSIDYESEKDDYSFVGDMALLSDRRYLS